MRDEKSWIQTYSGKKAWPLDPDAKDIAIIDIAHALSNICRFGGHTKHFYSVAQHSVMVSRICRPFNALAGLLHDASEAYLGDVVRPIKGSFHNYDRYEKLMQNTIFNQFQVWPGGSQEVFKMWEDIHNADNILLVTEKRDLFLKQHPDWSMPGYEPLAEKITPLSPEDAEDLFLEEFNYLTRGRY